MLGKSENFVWRDPLLNIGYKNLAFDFETYIKNELGFDMESQVKKEEQQVCKYYLRKSCSNRSCEFKHELPTRDKSVVCKHWLRGLCKKGDNCEFLHVYNMKKMPECWFYSKYEECSNGDECMYQHIDPDKKQKECPWYARGFCKHGPDCRNKHVRRDVCQNYLTGFCPVGLNCPNGHPKYELPIMQYSDGPSAPPRQRREESAPRPHVQRPQSGAPQGSSGNQFRRLEDVTCFKCGQQGHYANKCPPRYPDNQ